MHVATFDELDTRTLYSILRLRSEVFVVEQACAYDDLDGRDLEPGTRHIWLADEDGEPLAYLRLLEENEDGGLVSAGRGTVQIGRVVVAVQARRQGHAQALLRTALEIIGSRESTLNAQSYATELYESVGFKIDGDEFDEDGIPHVPMRRLTPQ